MLTPETHVARDADAAADEAADAVLSLIRESVDDRGRAAIALAGGSTPAALYRYLAERGRSAAPWDSTDLFFGDERCVPPTSADSNYALARDRLLDPLGITPGQVHRIAGERRPPAAAAEAYEQRLRGYFGEREPRFDLVLLGMGADGHTASLFPGSEALDEQNRWAVAVRAPAGFSPADRVTLTLPVLNRAAAVFFVVAGAPKRRAVKAALGARRPGDRVPAGLVRPSGRLAWFLDAAAAELLEA